MAETERTETESEMIARRFAWVKPIAAEIREVFGGFDKLTLIEDGIVIKQYYTKKRKG